MNKPVKAWEGSKGLHKEAIIPKISEKSLKKGARKVSVRLKHSKEDLHKAHAHMKKHGG